MLLKGLHLRKDLQLLIEKEYLKERTRYPTRNGSRQEVHGLFPLMPEICSFSSLALLVKRLDRSRKSRLVGFAIGREI